MPLIEGPTSSALVVLQHRVGTVEEKTQVLLGIGDIITQIKTQSAM
jgi:hypothetical protein